jgi:hypothetical protein
MYWVFLQKKVQINANDFDLVRVYRVGQKNADIFFEIFISLKPEISDLKFFSDGQAISRFVRRSILR